MMDPLLVQDSTFTRLAPSLESIAKSLDENATCHDYCVALLIVLLEESGFYLSLSNDTYERNKVPPCILQTWKSMETGIYEIKFYMLEATGVNCKLVALPSKDTLILNFFSIAKKRKTCYSMAVQSLKYVHPFSSDLSGRYINLRDISHRFKNTLATPLRVDILSEAGLPSPCLQGLPEEVLYRILGMLDANSLRKIAQCCQRFYYLCNRPQLWKCLARREFSANVDHIYNCKSYYYFWHLIKHPTCNRLDINCEMLRWLKDRD